MQHAKIRSSQHPVLSVARVPAHYGVAMDWIDLLVPAEGPLIPSEDTEKAVHNPLARHPSFLSHLGRVRTEEPANYLPIELTFALREEALERPGFWGFLRRI